MWKLAAPAIEQFLCRQGSAHAGSAHSAASRSGLPLNQCPAVD